MLKRPSARKRPASVAFTSCEHDDESAVPIDKYPPYFLISGPGIPKLRDEAPDFDGIEYNIARKRRAHDAPSVFAEPLQLDPRPRHAEDVNCEFAGTLAWDLHVWIGSVHTFYHRIAGLTLNKVCWGKNGRRLKNPYTVPLADWDNYVVHHLDWNPSNVERSNLAPLVKEDHDSLSYQQRLPGKVLPAL